MWKRLRVGLIFSMLVGISLWASQPPATALNLNPTSVNITITVTPLKPPVVTNGIGASNVGATTARLNGEVIDTGNENPTVTVFYGDTDGGINPASWNSTINLGIKPLGTFYYDASGLSIKTTYYYRMRAVNSGGTDWADSTENFTTGIEPPTGLIVTRITDTLIRLDWTKSVSSNTTLILVKVDSCPSDPTDGYQLYYGEGVTANDTFTNLDVIGGKVWYAAYSGNATAGYSSEAATGWAEGIGMTAIATAITELANTFDGIVGSAVFFAGIVLILGLLALALWRRDAVFFTVSGLVWFFVGISWINDYSGVSIAILGLAAFQLFEAVVMVLSSGGPSKGISQFRGLVNTIKGWF